MNKTIRYVEKVSLLKTVLGVLIACFSIYSFIFQSLFGIVPIAISLVLLQTKGVEIDLLSKKIKNIYSVLGIDFGKWKELPEIEYVSVFATQENIAIWASSASANVKNDIFKLNLFYDTNKKIEAYTTYEEKEAFEVGHHISEALNTDLLDATIIGCSKLVDKDIFRETGTVKYLE
ncbi:MAG: hypothetical protein GY932_14270 [Arcobacter sp.]|nr:hypothetical protein [Arcobacter sp.]